MTDVSDRCLLFGDYVSGQKKLCYFGERGWNHCNVANECSAALDEGESACSEGLDSNDCANSGADENDDA